MFAWRGRWQRRLPKSHAAKAGSAVIVGGSILDTARLMRLRIGCHRPMRSIDTAIILAIASFCGGAAASPEYVMISRKTNNSSRFMRPPAQLLIALRRHFIAYIENQAGASPTPSSAAAQISNQRMFVSRSAHGPRRFIFGCFTSARHAVRDAAPGTPASARHHLFRPGISRWHFSYIAGCHFGIARALIFSIAAATPVGQPSHRYHEGGLLARLISTLSRGFTEQITS